MNMHDFFSRLQDRGIRILLDENGALRVKGKKEMLDRALVSELKAHKNDIAQYLREQQEKQAGTSESQRHHLIHELNPTRLKGPEADAFADMTLHGLIEARAAQHPQQVAFSAADVELSYGQLNEKANQLAYYLRRNGVGQETLVGVTCKDGDKLLISLLAVLKAGGAYVCLDPQLPADLANGIVNAGEISYLLTDCRVEWPVPKIFNYHNKPFTKAVDSCATANLPLLPEQSAFSLACLIYTEIAQDKPLGVMVEHGNIIRQVNWLDFVDWDEQSKIAMANPHLFAPGLLETWGALANGATLCQFDTGLLARPGGLKQYISEYAISDLLLSSEWIAAINDRQNLAFEAVDTLLYYGAPLAEEQLALLRDEQGPNHLLAVYCCAEAPPCALVSPDSEQGQPLPGKPVSEAIALVVDEFGELVKKGQPGILNLGGLALARGYFNDLGLTEQRFKPNPYGDDPNDRLFDVRLQALHDEQGNVRWVDEAHSGKVHPLKQMLDEQWRDPVLPELSIEPLQTDPVSHRAFTLGQPVWLSQPIATQPTCGQVQAYLVFADNYGIGKALADQLRLRANQVIEVGIGEQFQCLSVNEYRIGMDNDGDYGLLVEALKSQGVESCQIVQLWCLDGLKVWACNEPVFEQVARFERYQLKGVQSARLMRQAAQLGNIAVNAITMVTHDTLSVTADEHLCPYTAPAAAVGSDIDCYHIDLSLDAGAVDEGRVVQLSEFVLNELSLQQRRDVVAYRGRQRWLNDEAECYLNGSRTVLPGKSGKYLLLGNSKERACAMVCAMSALISPEQLLILGDLNESQIDSVKVIPVDLANEPAMAVALRQCGDIFGVIYCAGPDPDQSLHAHRLMLLDALSRRLHWAFSLILLEPGDDLVADAANRFTVSFVHSQQSQGQGRWSCVGGNGWHQANLDQWLGDWFGLTACPHLMVNASN